MLPETAMSLVLNPMVNARVFLAVGEVAAKTAAGGTPVPGFREKPIIGGCLQRLHVSALRPVVG